MRSPKRVFNDGSSSSRLENGKTSEKSSPPRKNTKSKTRKSKSTVFKRKAEVNIVEKSLPSKSKAESNARKKSRPKESAKVTIAKTSIPEILNRSKQTNLSSFIMRSSRKKKYQRIDYSDSCELPDSPIRNLRSRLHENKTPEKLSPFRENVRVNVTEKSLSNRKVDTKEENALKKKVKVTTAKRNTSEILNESPRKQTNSFLIEPDGAKRNDCSDSGELHNTPRRSLRSHVVKYCNCMGNDSNKSLKTKVATRKVASKKNLLPECTIKRHRNILNSSPSKQTNLDSFMRTPISKKVFPDSQELPRKGSNIQLGRNAHNEKSKSKRKTKVPQRNLPKKKAEVTATEEVLKKSPEKQTYLESFLVKSDGKKTMQRQDSSDCCGVPSNSSRSSNRLGRNACNGSSSKSERTKVPQKCSSKKKAKVAVTEDFPKNSPGKQTNLKSFFVKSNKKKTIQRQDSSDSCDLPSFSKILNRSKSDKSVTKEQKALFKKYGVLLPTVEEILRDKEELERDKLKMQSFIPISEESLEFSFDLIDESPIKRKVLDCKHLSLEDLTEAFDKEFQCLSDINDGKIRNDRHERYFNKNVRVLTHSVKDLTYASSTVVFTYEQKEHLLGLLKEHFDLDDTKTKYFFQVLLPELCLRIFMDTYQMEYKAAVECLDEQPIADD